MFDAPSSLNQQPGSIYADNVITEIVQFRDQLLVAHRTFCATERVIDMPLDDAAVGKC
ncbi:MAG: hypothetical protein AB1649_10350 [Chloroflexota bacterium]